MSEEGRRWAARCWLQVRDASALCSRPSPSRHRRRTRAARTSRSAVRRPPAAATRLKRAEEGGEEASCAVKVDRAAGPRRVPVVHLRPSGRGPRTSSRWASRRSARRSSRTSAAAASSPRSTARAPVAGDVGCGIRGNMTRDWGMSKHLLALRVEGRRRRRRRRRVRDADGAREVGAVDRAVVGAHRRQPRLAVAPAGEGDGVVGDVRGKEARPAGRGAHLHDGSVPQRTAAVGEWKLRTLPSSASQSKLSICRSPIGFCPSK